MINSNLERFSFTEWIPCQNIAITITITITHARYLEFRSLRSSELSCTKNAGKPWIRLPMFQNHYFAKVFYPSFLLYGILYVLLV